MEIEGMIWFGRKICSDLLVMITFHETTLNVSDNSDFMKSRFFMKSDLVLTTTSANFKSMFYIIKGELETFEFLHIIRGRYCDTR